MLTVGPGRQEMGTGECLPPTALCLRAGLPRPWAALLVTTLVGGCDAVPGGGDAAGVVVRDSLGVPIIESAPDRELEPAGWRVAESPDLVIGVAEGDEAYQLFRVDGGAVLPDGRIVVVNGGTQELRYYDPDGRHLRSVGGRGDGPGEFQFPQLVPPLGSAGEQLVWDLMLGRFTVLGPDGEVVRTVTPEALVRTTVGWDGRGTVLSIRHGAAAGAGTPEGVMANDATFEGVALEGGDPVPVALMPGRVYHARIGGQPWFRRVPFDPEPTAAAGGGLFYVTSGSRAEVRAYTGAGDLVRIVRVLRDPPELRRAEFTALVEAQLETIADEDLRRAWRMHFGRMPVPELVPVYRSLMVDDTGHLWAEHFRTGTGGAATWSVFGPDGAAVGTVRTPEDLAVLHLGRDFVLGRARDDMGTEQVVRYALYRAAGGP